MKEHNDKGITERRKYLRFNAESKIDVKIREVSGEEKPSSAIEAITKNLSVEGIRFKSKKKLKPGAVVKLEITIPLYKSPLHLEGKVIWSKQLEDEKDKDIFDTGVKLFTLDKGDENKFIAYVCDKMMGRLGKYLHL